MKKLVLMLIIATLVSAGVFAEVRLDLGIKAPLEIGIEGLTDEDGNAIDASIPVPEFLPIPSGMIAGQLGLGPIKLGAGLNVYSVIVQTLLYPAVYAELDIGFLAAQLNLGGFVFGTFGIAGSSLSTSDLLIPDLSAHLKLGIFQVGLGVAAFTSSNVVEDAFPYVAYFSAKVSLDF